ncbi:MAG: hypothetical protein ACTSQI_13995 [Candidatus Helarchaeota archaeon]
MSLELEYEEMREIEKIAKDIVKRIEREASLKGNFNLIKQQFNRLNIRSYLEFAYRTIENEGYENFKKEWTALKNCSNPAISRYMTKQKMELFEGILDQVTRNKTKYKDKNSISFFIRMILAFYLFHFNNSRKKYSGPAEKQNKSRGWKQKRY